MIIDTWTLSETTASLRTSLLFAVRASNLKNLRYDSLLDTL